MSKNSSATFVKILLLCVGIVLLVMGSEFNLAIGSFNLSNDYFRLLPTLGGAAMLVFLVVFHFLTSKKKDENKQ